MHGEMFGEYAISMHLDYSAIIFSGIFFYWLLAVGQLVVRDRDIDHFISSLFFFSIGLWLFLQLCLSRWYFLIGLQISFKFIRAPMFYFYYKKIIDPDFQFSRAQIKHFLPGLIMLVFLLPLSSVFFTGQTSSHMVMNDPNLFMKVMSMVVLLIIGHMINLVYLFAILIENRNLFFLRHNRGCNAKYAQVILVQIVGIIVIIGIDFVEEMFHHPTGFGVSSICVTFFAVVFYLSIVRYPEYMRLVKQETQKIRYAQSRVQSLNLDRIFRQMKHFMEEERIFTDEGLSLPRFAQMLDIAPQQLSEILNHKMNKSFCEYINEYRIEEAKKILVEHTEAKIISVGFDVGFNTKSAFYNAFQKCTGQSPGAFRKTITEDKKVA